MRRYIAIFSLIILLFMLSACNDSEYVVRVNIAPELPSVNLSWYLFATSTTEATTESEMSTTQSEDATVAEVEEESVEQIERVFPDDASFWLNIPGTFMDYPVMWSADKDSEYWLEHAPDGEKSQDGSLFLDMATGGVATGITVINGHNRKNGKMFSDLVQYKAQSFADEHGTIQLITRDDVVREYKVFGVLLMDVNREAIQLLFRNEKAMRDYVDGLSLRSLVKTDVRINYNDIIALSTCSYEGPNYRCIVMCTLVS